eukprot:TRINITY_DN6863_c1_g1_i1.p2 TRINITY_DN6863_c1_g1~~TRINITY_DN6863_c1_g1_i1.p2  ORF type:complete len:179 (+),score=22.53 TRINITY_DN6863_c1_g1_i1:62-598(+)
MKFHSVSASQPRSATWADIVANRRVKIDSQSQGDDDGEGQVTSQTACPQTAPLDAEVAKAWSATSFSLQEDLRRRGRAPSDASTSMDGDEERRRAGSETSDNDVHSDSEPVSPVASYVGEAHPVATDRTPLRSTRTPLSSTARLFVPAAVAAKISAPPGLTLPLRADAPAFKPSGLNF